MPTTTKAPVWAGYDYAVDYTDLPMQEAKKVALEDAVAYLGSDLGQVIEGLHKCGRKEVPVRLQVDVALHVLEWYVGIQGLPARALIEEYAPELGKAKN